MKNIQLFCPKYRSDEINKEINMCLNSGWTGLGFKTIEFENAWKEYTKLPNAHFLNSSTSGLHLAIKILKDVNKWEDGDEIITTPLTFISSNHVILYENLKPVFVDVDKYLCLNPELVEKNITKKTRAVMYVGIGGNTGELNKIISICEKYKLKLILDAAHMAGTFIRNGFPAGYYDSHVGYDIDVTVFSFQSVKNLPTADSGMICFKNNDYDQLARKLSWMGIDKDTYSRSNERGNYKWEYDIVDIGYKYHGNSIMASMGLVGLKYLEIDNNRRREICHLYDNGFLNTNIKSIPIHSDCIKSSRHLYQIVVDNRNKIMEYLNIQGIYPGVHYRDNTNYKMYKYAKNTCQYSNIISEKLISLPLHMNITDDDVYYIVDKVLESNEIFNK